jgi:hypothetical protein
MLQHLAGLLVLIEFFRVAEDAILAFSVALAVMVTYLKC